MEWLGFLVDLFQSTEWMGPGSIVHVWVFCGFFFTSAASFASYAFPFWSCLKDVTVCGSFDTIVEMKVAVEGK